jgi:hypothetical protein
MHTHTHTHTHKVCIFFGGLGFAYVFILPRKFGRGIVTSFGDCQKVEA